MLDVRLVMKWRRDAEMGDTCSWVGLVAKAPAAPKL
jgi:hypothetical protein